MLMLIFSIVYKHIKPFEHNIIQPCGWVSISYLAYDMGFHRLILWEETDAAMNIMSIVNNVGILSE